jgi:hypothetical protein
MSIFEQGRALRGVDFESTVEVRIVVRFFPSFFLSFFLLLKKMGSIFFKRQYIITHSFVVCVNIIVNILALFSSTPSRHYYSVASHATLIALDTTIFYLILNLISHHPNQSMIYRESKSIVFYLSTNALSVCTTDRDPKYQF